MEHINEFLEKFCLRDDNKRIGTSTLCLFFKEFLEKEYPNVDRNFTIRLFTNKIKISLKNLKIPRESTNEIEYQRGRKSTLIVGLTLNDTFTDSLNKIHQDAKEKDKINYRKKYTRKNVKNEISNKALLLSKKFKVEFFKRTNRDIENEYEVVRYNNTVKKNLIIIVFNDDKSINWDETIKKTRSALINNQINVANDDKLINWDEKIKQTRSALINNQINVANEEVVGIDTILYDAKDKTKLINTKIIQIGNGKNFNLLCVWI